MIKWLQSRILWGALLIVGGVLILLQNVYGLQIGGYFWSLLFFLASLFFLGIFLSDRAQWWSLIPAFVLLSVGSIVLLDRIAPQISDDLGGFIVLAGIAIAFIAVYLVDRNNWWAIVPAGVMLTIAVFVLLESLAGGFGGVGIFFLGIGLTFVVLALVPTPEGRMKWAWIPALILVVVGLIISATTEAMLAIVWPVILILAGLILLIRAFIR